MRIHAKGRASRDFTPDQVIARVNFTMLKPSYQQALEEGSQMLANYIAAISERTDFNAEDFKTSSYNIREHFHYSQNDSKDLSQIGRPDRRVSDGFEFTQSATLTFDYDRERLAKLLLCTASAPDAPRFHIDFCLKDIHACRRELLPEAYESARQKAEKIAQTAGFSGVECEEIFLDDYHQVATIGAEEPAIKKAARLERFSAPTTPTFEDRLQTINENFHPEPITVSKYIDSIWTTR